MAMLILTGQQQGLVQSEMPGNKKCYTCIISIPPIKIRFCHALVKIFFMVVFNISSLLTIFGLLSSLIIASSREKITFTNEEFTAISNELVEIADIFKYTDQPLLDILTSDKIYLENLANLLLQDGIKQKFLTPIYESLKEYEDRGIIPKAGFYSFSMEKMINEPFKKVDFITFSSIIKGASTWINKSVLRRTNFFSLLFHGFVKLVFEIENGECNALKDELKERSQYLFSILSFISPLHFIVASISKYQDLAELLMNGKYISSLLKLNEIGAEGNKGLIFTQALRDSKDLFDAKNFIPPDSIDTSFSTLRQELNAVVNILSQDNITPSQSIIKIVSGALPLMRQITEPKTKEKLIEDLVSILENISSNYKQWPVESDRKAIKEVYIACGGVPKDDDDDHSSIDDTKRKSQDPTKPQKNDEGYGKIIALVTISIIVILAVVFGLLYFLLKKK